jgi:hypothetical protein
MAEKCGLEVPSLGIFRTSTDHRAVNAGNADKFITSRITALLCL